MKTGAKYIYLCVYSTAPTHLEVALYGGVDYWGIGFGLEVVFWHEHIHSDVSDGWLKIRLFSIYQKAYTPLFCTL